MISLLQRELTYGLCTTVLLRITAATKSDNSIALTKGRNATIQSEYVCVFVVEVRNAGHFKIFLMPARQDRMIKKEEKSFFCRTDGNPKDSMSSYRFSSHGNPSFGALVLLSVTGPYCGYIQAENMLKISFASYWNRMRNCGQHYLTEGGSNKMISTRRHFIDLRPRIR
ncbi:hypothetical protein ANN_14292 [Periplaneta americana]|uniref:Secreted protein n=1 Tax=Periplaneta americana TaxID=6978 RepID=A0ABQ8SXB9_PERAM|nr:hypothetical protein ANN_14292 [Periplaneta americana]